MKKKLSLVLLLTVTLCFNSLRAQQVTGVPYADALTIYNAILNDNNQRGALSILAHYYADPSISAASLARITGTNPFLSPYAASIAGITTPGVAGSLTGGLTNISGLNATNFADGTARFLIERGKQELSMAFFTRMRREFSNYPELAYLFPITSAMVNDIENHNILTLLQELRDAFMKDLHNAPTNILSLRNLPAACPSGDAACTARITAIRNLLTTGAGGSDPRAIIISLNVMQSFINGDNIITAFNRVAKDPSICGDATGFGGYLKLTSLIFNSLRTDKDGVGLFLNESDLRNLFNNEDLLNIFVGLVYQEATRDACYSSISINSTNLVTLLTQLVAGRNNFHNAIMSLDNVNGSYLAIRRQIQLGQVVDRANYASLTSSSLTTVSNVINAILPFAGGGALPASYAPLLNNLDIGADLCIDIQQRNYAGICNDVIRFLRTNSIVSNTTAQEKMIKYLSFGANLASATSGDEVKDAIDAVALPPGSYSVKQRSSWNIALNGYVGYAWDFNSVLTAKGLHAPVGFTVSKGWSKRYGGAVSFFTSIIDVGAIVSYRLTENTVDDLKQEVRLESIVSPSAQLVIGVPKLPISIAAGWRLTPKLFYTGNNEFKVIEPTNVFSTSILIDIPIANIWTRPYE